MNAPRNHYYNPSKNSRYNKYVELELRISKQYEYRELAEKFEELGNFRDSQSHAYKCYEHSERKAAQALLFQIKRAIRYSEKHPFHSRKVDALIVAKLKLLRHYYPNYYRDAFGDDSFLKNRMIHLKRSEKIRSLWYDFTGAFPLFLLLLFFALLGVAAIVAIWFYIPYLWELIFKI